MRFYFLFFLVGLCSLAAPDGRDEGSPGEQVEGRTWGHAGWWHWASTPARSPAPGAPPRPPTTFRIPESHAESEFVCVTWESPTGIVRFWLNGRPWPRKGLQKGYEVGNEAVVVLGQDQDTFGGGFDAQQSFVGEISEVYMWDVGLSNSEVKMLSYTEPYATPIFSWRNFPYKIEGEVYLVS